MGISELKDDLNKKVAESFGKLKEKFDDPSKIIAAIEDVFQIISFEIDQGKKIDEILAELDAKEKFEFASKLFELSKKQIEATSAIKEFIEQVAIIVVKKVITQGLL